MNLFQKELFGDDFKIKNGLGEVVDRVDLTTIDPILKTDNPNQQYLNSIRIVDNIKNLPTNKYWMYKEGHPRMPCMPVLKKNDITVGIGDSAHAYPRVNIGSRLEQSEIPADMHVLVARCFVPNDRPTIANYVDHLNERNNEICKEILDSFGFFICREHQADWRPCNLEWVTNGENVSRRPRSKKINRNLFMDNRSTTYFCV